MRCSAAQLLGLQRWQALASPVNAQHIQACIGRSHIMYYCLSSVHILRGYNSCHHNRCLECVATARPGDHSVKQRSKHNAAAPSDPKLIVQCMFGVRFPCTAAADAICGRSAIDWHHLRAVPASAHRAHILRNDSMSFLRTHASHLTPQNLKCAVCAAFPNPVCVAHLGCPPGVGTLLVRPRGIAWHIECCTSAS